MFTTIPRSNSEEDLEGYGAFVAEVVRDDERDRNRDCAETAILNKSTRSTYAHDGENWSLTYTI